MGKPSSYLRASMAVILLFAPSSSAHNSREQCRIRESITVNASPQACWDAIRNPASCRERRRVVSAANNEAIVEETFDNLPVIRTSVCVFKELEVPLRRIDYSLISSTKFKVMEGSWTITPISDGKTLVEVSSYLDTGIPFSRKMADELTQHKCKERLSLIKGLAETAEPKLACAAKPPKS